MLLFFDSETTGLVMNNLPHDHPAQPNLVQLGCVLAEDDGTTRATLDLIVKPEGYQIPKGASDVHGITTEMAQRMGLPLTLVVAAFCHLRSKADIIVAHNLPFDERVMATAIHRTGKASTLPAPVRRACTLEMAEPILKIPATAKMVAAGRANQYKKPNLGECYKYFFGEELEGAHSAIVDAQACAKIYFAMVRGETPAAEKWSFKRFFDFYRRS